MRKVFGIRVSDAQSIVGATRWRSDPFVRAKSLRSRNRPNGLRADASLPTASFPISSSRPKSSAPTPRFNRSRSQPKAPSWVVRCSSRCIDRTATVSPPTCATPYDRIEVKVALVQALRPLAASRGVQMLQACCDLDDAAAEEALTRGGFEFLATMLFMERAATKSSPKCQWDNRIRWVEYTAERRADFAQFIERSCEGALDCARLGEFRDVNLALESCRMRGSFDPSLRLLGEIDGAPARIILLIPQAESKTYELACMAVAPESRGKGLGRKVMEKRTERGRFAIQTARRCRSSWTRQTRPR